MLLKKVIVAEDDDSIAHMVNMALGDAGYLCIRARDGQEALQLVRMHSPDLLVLDVVMPAMSGHEVAERLKDDVILSRTPILMLTSMGDVDDKVKGFESGADDYLVKPFDLRELSARVAALIRASRRERERSPTTELPGSTAVEERVESLLREGREAAVVQLDVSGFDRFADAVGHSRADAFITALSRLLLDRVRGLAGDRGFLGHLGGSDFVAVVDPDVGEPLARAAIDAFEDHRRALEEGGEEGDRGEGAQGGGDEGRLGELGLAVAVVPTTDLGEGGSEELAARMARVMRSSKQCEGSSYEVWRPATP